MVEVEIGSFILVMIVVFVIGFVTGVVLQQRIGGTEDID